MDPAPLPGRVRPGQVLLGVGAVLVIAAGMALASASGGASARVLLLALAVAAAATSLRLARPGSRSAAETTAACAVGLALGGAATGGPVLQDAAPPVFALAGLFLALHLVAPVTTVWPVAAWAMAQLGVLRALDAVPPALRPATILGVALAGLVVALWARPVVGRLTALTTAPWWAVGVLLGTLSAWTDAGGQRWLSAGLVLGAATGLLVARLRWTLDVLLGGPRTVPVVAGLLLGSAVAGISGSLGIPGVVLVGYAGVLVGTTAAAVLTGWRRGLLLPVALAGGGTAALLATTRLVLDQRWVALSVLLLLTAAPVVVVAVVRREDRPLAVPVAVLCLGGAVLLLLPEALVGPVLASGVLTGLSAAAALAGLLLEPTSRRACAAAAIGCAAAAAVLLLVDGDRGVLPVHLALQGVLTLGWAARTDRGRVGGAPAWRVGPALIVLGAWIAAATAGLHAPEWYSIPAAAGMVVAGGARSRPGLSWPAWGPGLLVAAIPSALVAVLRPDVARAVVVLVVAAAVMVLAARGGARPPLVIGAVTAVLVTAGFTARALPEPLGAAIVVGGLLLLAGTLRDRPGSGAGSRPAGLL